MFAIYVKDTDIFNVDIWLIYVHRKQYITFQTEGQIYP